MAIATANSRVAHRDMGGATPDPGIGGPPPSPMTAGNPNISGYLQRLQAMSPDQLRVLAMRSGGSQMGQMAQQVLQRKLVMPNAGGAPAPAPMPAQAGPPQGLGAPPQVSSAPPQAPQAPMMRRGGRLRRADGGPADISEAPQATIPPPGTDDEILAEMHRQDLEALRRSDNRSMYPLPGTIGDGAVARHIPRDGVIPYLLGQQSPYRTYNLNDFAAGGHIRGYADGGMPSTPWFVRAEARGASGSQYYGGSTPGRADLVNATPPAGSYVIPADVVSGHGEGNSDAGARAIEEAMSTGPHGVPLRGENVMPVRGRGLPPAPHDPRLFNLESRGGSTGNVPVRVSHGELLIGPDKVREIGGGNLSKGHRVLDEFVKQSRAKNIATLKALPGPART